MSNHKKKEKAPMSANQYEDYKYQKRANKYRQATIEGDDVYQDNTPRYFAPKYPSSEHYQHSNEKNQDILKAGWASKFSQAIDLSDYGNMAKTAAKVKKQTKEAWDVSNAAEKNLKYYKRKADYYDKAIDEISSYEDDPESYPQGLPQYKIYDEDDIPDVSTKMLNKHNKYKVIVHEDLEPPFKKAFSDANRWFASEKYYLDMLDRGETVAKQNQQVDRRRMSAYQNGGPMYPTNKGYQYLEEPRRAAFRQDMVAHDMDPRDPNAVRDYVNVRKSELPPNPADPKTGNPRYQKIIKNQEKLKALPSKLATKQQAYEQHVATGKRQSDIVEDYNETRRKRQMNE